MILATANVHNRPSTIVEQPRKFLVRRVAQFPDEERMFADAHEQQHIGGELHDFVGVHEVAGGKVLGFAQGSLEFRGHYTPRVPEFRGRVPGALHWRVPGTLH